MAATIKRLKLREIEQVPANAKQAEDPYAKSKLGAYLLLSAIQSMMTANQEVLRLLQNLEPFPDGGAPPLEYLLFIGICADESSMVATTAFKRGEAHRVWNRTR
jgi:hypothetical protein